MLCYILLLKWTHEFSYLNNFAAQPPTKPSMIIVIVVVVIITIIITTLCHQCCCQAYTHDECVNEYNAFAHWNKFPICWEEKKGEKKHKPKEIKKNQWKRRRKTIRMSIPFNSFECCVKCVQCGYLRSLAHAHHHLVNRCFKAAALKRKLPNKRERKWSRKVEVNEEQFKTKKNPTTTFV